MRKLTKNTLSSPAPKKKHYDDEDFSERFDKPLKPAYKKSKKEKDTAPPPPVNKKLVTLKNASVSAGTSDNSHLKDLQAGMEVHHERFGNGKVLHIEGVFPNSKATVHFETQGQKQLLLKFAKLTIVT